MLGEATGDCRHALLLHGAGGGGWEWAIWQPVLEAEGIAVHALDLMPVAAGLQATRLDDYVVQARAALAALPRPRAAIGASLGGLLAVIVADAADALVLVNPLPPSPWAGQLPSREWPDVVPWGRDARLASTRRALPDADPATTLFAFRRWRDESGAVLREAHAGVAMAAPVCRTLCIASEHDEDVPAGVTAGLARAWSGDCMHLADASHVGPCSAVPRRPWPGGSRGGCDRSEVLPRSREKRRVCWMTGRWGRRPLGVNVPRRRPGPAPPP
ncbi:alpha/beta fold hydrolase [Marilutibacter alkalisoli]|uniref:Alpha/beta fold hydrolase n=1 Tax=Marilutibacter alkalisoli TaxID=2591633 RepID=A0A514BPS9_9GAMM|nr:alpha/beta fold hydrolase [Lysobacter alkalisoli]QDH69384.1 alpha/beta fold hydrolase [Lysobacter alkalisoli]